MYLFVIYGLFILILLVIFFIFTYTHYQKNALEEASRDLENMCSSVENSVEAQLDNISTISLNITYSNVIKSNFKEFFDIYKEDRKNPEQLVASRENVKAIYDIVTAMIGAYQSASDIRLYTMDGYCVQAGFWQITSLVDLESFSWYKDMIELNGHKYIGNPEIHKELPAQGKNKTSQKFISLVRLFLDSAGQPEGIIEVIQDCDKLFSLAGQLEHQNPDSRVYIYNSRHKQVYPYNSTGPLYDYYQIIEDQNPPVNSARLIDTKEGENLLFTYQSLPDYNWTVILIKPKAAVYEPLRTFQVIFTLIGGLSILFTLLICFYISQRLTVPLQKLTAATGKITINRVLDENKVNLTSADSNIKELSILCESIRTMYEKLRSTSQEILLSHSEETKAKLQATQSLINPHFLYNSLTSISIMAEESMNEDIIKMCQALCGYFRYISSSSDMLVTLKEEIFYTQCYLECMELRFTEELTCTLDIPEETENIYIPKLITQPIVENAFKYAFEKQPPWTLSISSSLEHNQWLLLIEDNGGNLDDEKKQELLNVYQNLDLREELKSMEIGGMGLKNVYLRLKMLYGDQAVFKIENSLPQKTVFIVGGPIYTSKEEFYEHHPPL